MYVDLAERVAKAESLPNESFQLNDSAVAHQNSHHVGHLSARLDHIEKNWESDAQQKNIMAKVEEHLGERLPQLLDSGRKGSMSPLEEVARLEVALSGNLANTDARVQELEGEIVNLKKAMGGAATVDEVEDLRDEVVDALEAVKDHKRMLIHKHGPHSDSHMSDFHLQEKENALAPGDGRNLSKEDRASIMDEVALSRPDRSEIELLMMTRIEVRSSEDRKTREGSEEGSDEALQMLCLLGLSSSLFVASTVLRRRV